MGPTNIIFIRANAFSYTKITKIEIPRSVQIIDDAFAFAFSQLEEVVFQSGSQLHTIGQAAFWGTKITKIEIPRSVKIIDSYAFYKSQLEEVVFENDSQLEKIGAKAFGVDVSDFILLFFIISFNETYLSIYLFHFLFLGFRKHTITNY